MKLLALLVKFLFFFLVLWFALKNTTPVPVRFTAETTLEHVPLIVVMLVCIAIGALLGALALALPMYRMRRAVGERAAQPAPAEAVSASEPLSEDDVASAARRSGAVVELGPERR